MTRCLLTVLLFLGLVPPSAAQDLDAAKALLAGGEDQAAADAFEAVTRLEPGNADAWFGLAAALGRTGDLRGSLAAAERAVTFPKVAPWAFYNKACTHARLGEIDTALEAFESAKRLGFHDRDQAAADPDLEKLRADPRFVLPSGRQRRQFEASDGTLIAYHLVVPPDFDAGKTYPVMIALGPGSESLEAAGFVLDHFWGEQAAQRGWIVAAPAKPGSGWQNPRGVGLMAELLDHLAATYRVEGQRFHLGGCSNGGNSAFHLAVFLAERFQSLTVVPGSISTATDLSRLRDLRLTLYVGARDRAWKRSAEQLDQRLRELGADVHLHVVPDAGHVLPELFGDRLIVELDALRSPDSTSR